VNPATNIAIIFNGSPLSNGDCGSGESEIRRWILENDRLDAIIMLPDQLFYNTGIFTYIWLLRNNKPPSHRGRVMIIDARKQFEKEPKSFGNKRNRITAAHRKWIEERYCNGWADGYTDECVKLFKQTDKEKDFAYHKVSVVFWQTDENDKPAIVTEKYEKAFTAQNIKKEQEFYESDLEFKVRLIDPDSNRTETISLKLTPKDNFGKIYDNLVMKVFNKEIEEKTKELKTEQDKKRMVKRFTGSLQTDVEWTHRHYVQDDEYIPFGEDIEAFLKREIAKPIIRCEDSSQLGYEILPNKYFYKYQPPMPANDLLEEFWNLEKDAEKMLEGLDVDRD
jgi:type I restriction enzyme M protein